MKLVRNLLPILATFLAWGATAQDNSDPIGEVGTLLKDMSADTAALRQLAWRADVQWPVEQRSRTMQQRALASLAKGRILVLRNDFDGAAMVFDSVIARLEGTPNDRLLATACYFRSMPELSRNQIAAGIGYMERALRITTRSPYPQLDAALEKDIAWSYSQLNDDDQARIHFLKALALPLTSRDRFWTSNSLIEVEIRSGRFADARQHIGELKKMRGTVNDKMALVELSNAELALAQGDPETAIQQFNIALATQTANGSFTFQAWTLSRLSAAYRAAGQPAMAVAKAREGLQLAQRHNLPKETNDNEGELYQALAAAGNKASAFDHFQRYITRRDSTSGITASAILTASMLRAQMAKQAHTDSLLRAEKELRRTEQHRAEMQQERMQRNIFLFASLALLVFGAVTLRQRNKVKKARDRSDELLLNILPEEVAQELKEKGEAEAQLIQDVTVLFTDFKGFTQLSEQLTARELVHEINTCFRAFDDILSKYGVEKIKTIGDAYMAAGGMPIPSADSARSTVLAGLDMQAFMLGYKAEREAQGKPFFEMRVGIHTGSVVAGIVGVKKFQYDIWGDTVNTASRMESSGEVGKVNISEATYQLIVGSSQLSERNAQGPSSLTTDNKQPTTPEFTFTPRGKVQAKGKGEMEMYFVRRSDEITEENFARRSNDSGENGFTPRNSSEAAFQPGMASSKGDSRQFASEEPVLINFQTS